MTYKEIMESSRTTKEASFKMFKKLINSPITKSNYREFQKYYLIVNNWKQNG